MASTSQTIENVESTARSKPYILLLALLLALIFTVTLDFMMNELPRQINLFLRDPFPDYDVGLTEQRLLVETQLRPLGYLCFLCILLLVFLGFLCKRSKITFLGSLTFYLPIFGHFAGAMFLFAGIGVLRICWMPLLDFFSIDFLTLGDIVLFPYHFLRKIILYIGRGTLLMELIAILGGRTQVFAYDFAISFSNAMISTGMLIFLFSVMTWIYGQYTSHTILDFWIYKYIRHPQYLGLLVWSYGILIQTGLLLYPLGGYVPVPSFPWVLSTLIIIGIALQEELKLHEEYSDVYATYCNQTAFIFPLPRQISTFITRINSLIIRKARPEHTKDILILLTVYCCISIFLSLIYI